MIYTFTYFKVYPVSRVYQVVHSCQYLATVSCNGHCDPPDFHCFHSTVRCWDGAPGVSPRVLSPLQHWKESPGLGKKEGCCRRYFSWFNVESINSAYDISGVESICKHKLLPYHDSHLVTQVVKPVRLVESTSPDRTNKISNYSVMVTNFTT